MSITKAEMRKSVNSKSALWMKFTSAVSKGYHSYLHVFFEGEDGSYYSERINHFSSYNPKEIINYDCGGKDNVVLLWKKIKLNEYHKKVKTRFFVDKDYGLDSKEYDDLVYVTPNYSFENFYLEYMCFEKILINEFRVNSIDEEFLILTDIYINRLMEYKNIIANFNAFIICFHKLQSPIVIERCKISDFIDIYIDRIDVKKVMNFDTLKEYFHNKLTVDLRANKKYAEENFGKFDDAIDEVEKIFEEELKNVLNNLDELSHGKLEFYFLRNFLEDLKKSNSKKSIFKETRTSVFIDPQSKGLVSYLSKYAETPPCLIEFLKDIKGFKKSPVKKNDVAV